MNSISRILLKYFTFGVNDEEAQKLDRWRKESDRNETLFHKLGSRDFLEQAMDPRHKKELGEQWGILEKKIWLLKRKRLLLQVSQWAAVIVIPLLFILVYVGVERGENVRENGVVNTLKNNSKVIVRLAEGEQIVIHKDTVFQIDVPRGQLKNQGDTITFLPKESGDVLSGKVHRLEVPRGAEYVACLEDGSVVHMDAASILLVPEKFAGNVREVELIGHAYFVVAKDSLRPFIVKSGSVNVRVLGTEFDFNAYQGQDVSTTLVNGVVEVYNGHSRYRMKPNQQAKIGSEGQIVITDVDVYPFIAWKEERIVFINEPLEAIMKVLERWYDVQSVFISSEIKNECFTVDVEKYEKIDNVLHSIEKTEKVHFEVNGKQIFIHKNN